MSELTLDNIEFVIGAIKAISDKVTISGVEYLITPSSVLDKAIEAIREQAK